MQNMEVDVEGEAKEMIPRTYQIQMERTALKTNTILFLPTGSGKTFVAIQVIKRLQEAVHPKYSEGGQRSFFLVNSVPLVDQQTTMLSRQLALTIKGYSSENKVDLWKMSDWLNELEEAQVLVMTAQILLDMLRHSYITLNRINVMVFDECHHAVDSHPMRSIMTLFDGVPSSQRPRVLGLTATLINKNVKVANVAPTIKELEKTFNAKICTVDVLDEVSLYSTNPVEMCLYYPEERAHQCVTEVLSILGQLRLLAKDLHIPSIVPNAHNKNSQGISLQKPEKLSNIVKCMADSIERTFVDLGIYGGDLAILCHTVQCERFRVRADQAAKHNILQIAITYFTQARGITQKCLETLKDPAEKLLKFSTPKMRQLCEMLKEYSPSVINSTHSMKVNKHRKDLCSLIFVKERFTSKVVYKMLDHASQCIPHLEYLKCDFVVGTNINPYSDIREDLFNKKQNMLVLEKFRANQINCLVSTEVMEEGIDIPLCNLVVRLDPIISFRSYVQAKGRGRSKTSVYSIMVSEKDSTKFNTNYANYKAVEEYLSRILVGSTDNRSLPSLSEQAEKYKHLYPPYTYRDAIITVESAVSLLSRYCQTLPHDKFTQVQPEFFLVPGSTTLMKLVNVYLPLNCPLREPIQGAEMPNINNAKRVAALKACEALHKANELDDNLLPINRAPENFDDDVEKTFFSHWLEEEDVDLKEGDKPRPKPGTKNKKRLHYRKFPKCLSGSSANASDVLHRYYVHYFHLAPQVESQDENHLIIQDLLNSPQGFLLLTAHPLPKVCPFTLYLTSGQVTVTLEANKKVLTFTAQQMEQIRRIHMVVFLDVLEVMKEFTCYDPTHGDNHYWVVPTTNGCDICWETVTTHRSVEPQVEPSDLERKRTSTDAEYYRHMVVYPWYRVSSPKYIVTKVLGCTPLDAFSDESYSSYASYFKSKYNLSLLGPREQPMLEVQYLGGKMNCLLPRSVTLNSGVKSKRLRMNLEQQYTKHTSEQLVPEFCIRFSFPGVLWLKASILPSMLHRLTQILTAEELRCQINKENGLGCERVPEGVDWNVLSSNHHAVNSAQLHETEGKRDTTDDGRCDRMEEDEEQETVGIDEKEKINGAENATSLTAIHNEDTYKLAFKRLAKDFPWSPDMEPLDIERQFDKMSIADIECYDRFVLHKIDNIAGSPSKIQTNTGDEVAEKIIRMRAICAPPHKQVGTIEILNKTIDNIGPQLSNILEALTTAKCNDIVSMERLETLGDSFLKFGVSLYLVHKFPHYDEGRLTVLKGKIVSNRNLFYSGMSKDLPGRIKIENFSAKEGWVPPSFCVEKNIQKILIESNVSPAALYFISLNREEILSGRLQASSWSSVEKAVLNWDDTVEYSAGMDMYVNRQEVPDKVVSDCVEALIGAYLQHGGTAAASRMLSWFHILPKQEKLEVMLTDKIQTPYTQGKVSKDHINFLLDHSITKIQNIIQYNFNDPSLLLEALTHSSTCHNKVTGSYERLEFLGDAVLDFLVTCYIYEQGDRLTPGQLTDLRSALVNNNTFACLVVRMGLHKFMLTSNTLLNRTIDKFVSLQEGKGHIVDESVLYLLEEEDCNLAQYIEVPKALGDIFESLAGAIYLDCGGHLPTVWTVFHSIMAKEIALFMENVPKNPVRLLGEQIHALPKFQPSRLQPGGIVMMPLRLWISGKSHLVYGFGKNKAMAKRSASKIALRLLGVTSS